MPVVSLLSLVRMAPPRGGARDAAPSGWSTRASVGFERSPICAQLASRSSYDLQTFCDFSAYLRYFGLFRTSCWEFRRRLERTRWASS